MAASMRFALPKCRRIFSPVFLNYALRNSAVKKMQTHVKIASSLMCQSQQQRWFTRGIVNYSEHEDATNNEDGEANNETEEEETAKDGVHRLTGSRRLVHDLETSMRYLESEAFKVTYGGVPVWVPYRRNHKGLHPPRETRKTCVRSGIITTGNPCPICRDEYLVIHPENLELLKQFISPHTGEVLSYKKTGVCQVQQKNLIRAVYQAWDTGLLEKPIPYREYDYTQYYPEELLEQSVKS